MNDVATPTKTSPAWQPPGLLAFAQFMARRIRWAWLLLPIVLAVVMIAAYDHLPFAGVFTKNGLESAAIVLMSTAVGVALLRTVIERRAFLVWLTALAGALLFREFHLHKTSTTITYVCIIALAVIMWRCYAPLAAYLSRPRVPTLLAMMVSCYFISQSLDFDYFKYNYPHLPLVEEVVEVMGHLCILTTVIVARATTDPELPQTQAATGAA